MNITIIGAGYVGLVTGACLAEVGNSVFCVDSDHQKINRLACGDIPVYEPGLDVLIDLGRATGRIVFSEDIAQGVAFGDIIMVAVGTPQAKDGTAELGYVFEVARAIGTYMESYKIIVNKSTVPVGTGDRVRSVILSALCGRSSQIEFDVVSNPEFLKEGSAIEDFQKPDRIVIGTDSKKATEMMREVYTPFNRNHERLIFMDVRSAELTKYASNAMLATKISFMNEFANLAERVGADIESVRLGVGSDPRIGYDFIYPGCGYGGSCFPKDLEALCRTGEDVGYAPKILSAVQEVNNAQKMVLVSKVVKEFGGNLAGKHFAVWGLAFKPNTDDMREAPSVTIILELINHGATVSAFDPVAKDAADKTFAGQDNLLITDNAYAALDGADGLLVVTEWKMFRSPDFEIVRARMRGNLVFDGRNIYDPDILKAHGLIWFGIGRPVAESLNSDSVG